MNSEYIHSLLKKYWDCETSVQEEKELQTFFSTAEVPEELQIYTPLFAYIKDEKAVSLSESFNEKLQKTIGTETKERYVTIRIFRPLLRIAVSVLLVIAVGVSVYFIARQDNRPQFVETFQDPDTAMQHAVLALEKIAVALQKTETASVETIQFIDELNIDWATIDSLNRAEKPLEME